MSRDRSLPAIFRVKIQIMIGTVTFEITSCINKLTDELMAFQTSTPISFVWTSEEIVISSSTIMSLYAS
jgi:hypothetical protein